MYFKSEGSVMVVAIVHVVRKRVLAQARLDLGATFTRRDAVECWNRFSRIILP